MSKIKVVGHETFEFVEFQVGLSRFGISITLVREIIEPIQVTFIPHSHPYIKGIIQLRGEVLPVIDFQRMTGASGTDAGAETKYIVFEINGTTMVLEVFAVTEIERVQTSDIEQDTELYEGEKLPMLGVIKQVEEAILLVDFEKAIATEFGLE